MAQVDLFSPFSFQAKKENNEKVKEIGEDKENAVEIGPRYRRILTPI
jgi:hypothetical protein